MKQGCFRREAGFCRCLWFDLRQTSGAPALPGRSSEGETGLFQTSPRAPARDSKKPRMRRPHVAVGVSPWNSGAPKAEPRRRRQRVASGRQPRAIRRRRPVRMAPHSHGLCMDFRPPTRPEVVWGRPQRHTVLCARLSPARRKSRNRRKTRRRLEGCPGSHWRWN